MFKDIKKDSCNKNNSKFNIKENIDDICEIKNNIQNPLEKYIPKGLKNFYCNVYIIFLN